MSTKAIGAWIRGSIRRSRGFGAWAAARLRRSRWPFALVALLRALATRLEDWLRVGSVPQEASQVAPLPPAPLPAIDVAPRRQTPPPVPPEVRRPLPAPALPERAATPAAASTTSSVSLPGGAARGLPTGLPRPRVPLGHRNGGPAIKSRNLGG